MKILLGNFSLAAGDAESPEDLRIDGRREVQTATFLRAVGAAVLARGNRLCTVSFAITREHASYGAAESFLFSHAATLPASGAVRFICEDQDGAQVQYTALAAVATDQGRQLGVTTTHRYQLICGSLTGGSVALDAGVVDGFAAL